MSSQLHLCSCTMAPPQNPPPVMRPLMYWKAPPTSPSSCFSPQLMYAFDETVARKPISFAQGDGLLVPDAGACTLIPAIGSPTTPSSPRALADGSPLPTGVLCD